MRPIPRFPRRPRWTVPGLLVGLLAAALLPAQDLVYRIADPLPGDAVGQRVHALGDVDGDGVPDFLMAGGPDPASTDARVVSGATGRIVHVLASRHGQRIGTHAAGVGDLDGDGSSEYLVSAPGDATRGQGAGAVFLIAGRSHAIRAVFRGDHAGAELGPVANLRDVDGDGTPDFALGAPGHAHSGTGAGAVWVISGRDRLVLRAYLGSSPGDGQGAAVLAMSDLDGDGVRELAYVARRGTFPGTNARIAVRSGRTGALLWERDVPPTPNPVLALADAGDTDGDGLADLAAGGSTDTALRILLLSGRDGSVRQFLTRPVDASGFGSALAGVGDVDRDGRADLLVGIPRAQGGPAPEGLLRIHSGRDARILREWTGAVAAALGTSVAPLGDSNGDLVGEFLAGAPGHGSSPGAVLVHSLAPLTMAADRIEIPLASGGSQRLDIAVDPRFGLHDYWVLGTASGILPGIGLGGLVLPLNPDGYLFALVAAPGARPLRNGVGRFGLTTRATAYVDIPAGLPQSLLGLDLHHAALILRNGTPAATTHAAPLRLVAGPPTTRVRVYEEAFRDTTHLDRSRSAGSWSGGTLNFRQFGGDGLHGDFDPSHGREVEPKVYEWSTDSQRIPASATLSGREEIVTNGVFRFSRFDLPKGVIVRFLGTKPAWIEVRGDTRIVGRLESNGAPLFTHNGILNTSGQVGSAGGAFAGRGGTGADQGDGQGTLPRFHGQPGEDVRVLPGHAYFLRTPGTGGQGSSQFPTSGLNADVTYNGFSGSFCGQLSAGGGGGGMDAKGADGVAFATMGKPSDLGPSAAGGLRFDWSTGGYNPPTSTHFLIGGSGGGGGGSHPYFSIRGPSVSWRSGAGGTGGGGAILLRTGNEFLLGPDGEIQVRGGDGPLANTVALGPAAPGGGGSGGTIHLQTGYIATFEGILDVSGGLGGRVDLGFSYVARLFGGGGSPGVVRIEQSGSFGNPPRVRPSSATLLRGPVVDSSQHSGLQSRWMSIGRPFAPRILRYELRVDNVTWSDDPARGMLASYGSTAPLWILFQAGRIDPLNPDAEPVPTGPWRSMAGSGFGQPGIDGDQSEAFRFVLIAPTPPKTFRVAFLRLVLD
ncbi:MAG: FG-GAP repeat protein [Planctomycetes bacterium]|nr:FG-GAP repeat protein [Planctomycetota bacterium]